MKLSKKRALFNSVLSLVLCVSMLLGTTFAWFTDEVTSTGNIIKSGALDVEMLWNNDNGTEWTDASKGAIFNYQYWEPGYTDVKYLKVQNKGDLAFRYQFRILPDLVDADSLMLSRVIDVYCGIVADGEGKDYALTSPARGSMGSLQKMGTLYEMLTNPNGADGGILLPVEGGGNVELAPDAEAYKGEVTVCLVLKMQESAGNEYQNKTLGGSGFKVQLLATQYTYEKDSFGADYDTEAQLPALGTSGVATGSANVTVDADGKTTEETTITTGNADVKATLPAGVKMADGATSASYTLAPKTTSDSNITTGDGEQMAALDVHVGGVAADNTTPIIVELGKVLPVGMNMGNIALYHVEKGVTNKMTQVSTYGELDAHNEFYYDPATGFVTVAMATFSEVTIVAEEPKWEGNFDYSWYAKRTGDDYTIANADQLAAFGAIVGGMDGQTADTFKGKTVKLIANINLGDKESENNPDLIFYPIGYYNSEGTYERTNTAITSGFKNFEGTFDGNGHTIANFYQNTWEMKGDNNYYDAVLQYYRDGMGLFGRVYKGTIKNLTVQNFSSDGEYTTTGTIAAYADGATFENIAIFNCNPRVYNIGNGGIVGCVGWYAKEADLKTTFKNITVDNSNKISALWGSYDVACGGLVGQYYPTSGQTSAGKPANGGIEMENCHVAAQMDVYNDVCANYQYYAYRYAGILIGSVRENVTIDGHSYPKMDGITARDCTVHFGDWNDYYYCELVDNTTASYTHDYQMSRLVEIKAINGTTITYLDDTTGTVPASGRANYVIVDYTKGHGTENATCYHFLNGEVWNHEAGGKETVNGVEVLKEDKQHLYLEFNNLVTGYGWGVTSKGVGDLANVTILDREEGKSVKKFAKADTAKESYTTGTTVTIGNLFEALEKPEAEIKTQSIQVAVSPVGEGSTAGGKYEANTDDWTKGTLTFSGTGAATITITDYYFCTPTTITVTIEDKQPVEKFDVVMNNGDFLHRVGNSGTVALDKLFKAKDGVTVDDVSVTIESVDDTGASGTYTANTSWAKGTIQFRGTGVVKVTITDNDYCNPTVLYLEVVDAVNVTTATNATANNVVLLNDIGSGFTVSGRYTVYGNGFTLNYTGDGRYLNNGLKQGVVTVSENGTLDNLRIKASIYPTAFMYYGQTSDGDYVQQNSNPKEVEGDKTRYYYQLSAVVAKGNATISNCYIYGGRNNIFIDTGNVTVEDTILECAPVANVQIQSTNEYTVTFEDVTTIQYQVNNTVGDTSKVMLGAGVVVGPDTETNPTIVLNGKFKQYNWVTEDDEEAVSGEMTRDIINGALDVTAYNHAINGKKASNLGIIYMNQVELDVKNNTGLPYKAFDVSLSGAKGKVYSLQNASAGQIYSDYANADRATVNGDYIPAFDFDLGNQEISYDGSEDTRYLYGDANGVTALYQDRDKALTLDLSKLATIYKYTGKNYTYTAVCKDPSGNTLPATNNVVTLSGPGNYTLVFTVADNIFYNQNGEQITKSVERTFTVPLSLTVKEASIENAVVNITKTELVGEYTVANFTDYKLQIKFLDAISVTDYNKEGNGTTVSLSKNIASATLTPAGVNVFTTASTITITYNDGRVLTVNLSKISGSSPGTKTAAVNTSGEVHFITDGALDNKPTKSSNQNKCTITSVSFKGNNGSTVTNDTDVTVTWPCDSSCVTGDTLVTLVDGGQKRIDEVTCNDQLLVWNFFDGKYEAMPSAIIFNHGYDYNTVIELKYSDGTVVKAVNLHQFFDADLNTFVTIDADTVSQYVGHKFVKRDGDGHKLVTLVDYGVREEYEAAFGIISAGYYNILVEGMFSTDFMLEDYDLFNYFAFGEDMKFDVVEMQADIEKYGLYTYEDFADYLTREQFDAFNVQFFKIPVGKGLYTYEGILALIEEYLNA